MGKFDYILPAIIDPNYGDKVTMSIKGIEDYDSFLRFEATTEANTLHFDLT